MKLTNNPDDAQDWSGHFERDSRRLTASNRAAIEAWMTTIERNSYFNQYAKGMVPAARTIRPGNTMTGYLPASEHASQGLESAEERYLDTYAPEEIMAALNNPALSAGRCSSTLQSTAVLPAGGGRARCENRYGDEPAQSCTYPTQAGTRHVCERTRIWCRAHSCKRS